MRRGVRRGGSPFGELQVEMKARVCREGIMASGGCRGGSCAATLLLTQDAISVARRTVDEFAVDRAFCCSLLTLWQSIGSMDKDGPSGSRMFASHLILQPPHLSRRLTSRVRYRSGLPFSFFPLDLAPHGRTRPLSPNGKLSFRRRGGDSYLCLARVCALVKL